MARIAIIGTTSWGTTLGVILAKKGGKVKLWARTQEEADELNSARENLTFLPGIQFPPGLHTTASLEEALAGANMVILATPAQTLRTNIRTVSPFLESTSIVLSAAKGLEVDTLQRMSEVIAEEIPPAMHQNICVLSGPNISMEIARGLPAATVVAARNEKVMARAQKLLTCRNLCVYTNSDVVGVELGGALKNVIALGAGMADGLEMGDNAKAAFIIRGLAEITSLGVAAGANPFTFAGLAGLGDLIVTCASQLSRNHYTGSELAKGRSLQDITGSMRSVAEGVPTTKAAYQLARKLGQEVPITSIIYRVLFEGLSSRQAVSELMGRPVGDELQVN